MIFGPFMLRLPGAIRVGVEDWSLVGCVLEAELVIGEGGVESVGAACLTRFANPRLKPEPPGASLILTGCRLTSATFFLGVSTLLPNFLCTLTSISLVLMRIGVMLSNSSSRDERVVKYLLTRSSNRLVFIFCPCKGLTV